MLYLKQKGAVNKVIFVYNGEQAVAVINDVKANVGLTGKALELWVIHFEKNNGVTKFIGI